MAKELAGNHGYQPLHLRGRTYHVAAGPSGIVEDGSQRVFFPNGFAVYVLAEALHHRDCDYEKVKEDYFRYLYGEYWREAEHYLTELTALFDADYLEGEMTKKFLVGGKNIMKLDFTLYECGVSTAPPDWLFYVNNQHLINRVYYVIEEGAGYIYKGERIKFLKNHLYVLPHLVDIEYFLDDEKFLHFFVDFSSSTTLNYNEVLSFPVSDYPLINKNLDYLRFFLKEKLNNFFSTLVTPYDLYGVKERVGFAVSTLFYDIMEEFPVPSLFDSSITKSVNYIQENYQNHLTRSELARHVNLSESYFSKLFTETTGISPYQYIKNYRFDIAISLISQGVSVNETAEKCGFSSVSAFSNSFKKKFGYSPSEYNK